MKQLIPVFSLALVMAACSSTPNGTATGAATQTQGAPAYNSDTVGLAQFQQWKAANELAALKQYTIPTAAAVAPVKKARTVYTAPAHTSSRASGSGSNASANSNGGTMSSESSNTAKAAEKRGWSKAAKGTAIGAGVGAAAGAVI